MKNSVTKIIDKIVGKALKMNINSTTSIVAFQPKVPKELSVFKKTIHK